MRIGFDVDGVLANFFTAYEKQVIEKANGLDLFGQNKYPDVLPPVWNWPEHYGYDNEIVSKVWSYIKDNPIFWDTLTPLPALDLLIDFDYVSNDLYFITDRPGQGAQAVTANWLASELGFIPSLIISRKGKGLVANALDLDLYIDDKVENVLDCQEKAPEVRTYLAPQYPYNLNHKDFPRVKLTQPTVKEVLITERII
jgi:hypothetical protein